MSTIAPSKVFYSPENISQAVVQMTGQAELCRAESSALGRHPMLYLAFDLPAADRKKFLKNVTVSVPLSYIRKDGTPGAVGNLAADALLSDLSLQSTQEQLIRNHFLPPISAIRDYPGKYLSADFQPGASSTTIPVGASFLMTGGVIGARVYLDNYYSLKVSTGSISVSYTAVTASLLASSLQPAAYADRSSEIVLSWGYTAIAEGVPVEIPRNWELQPASAEIQWKNGSSGTVHTLTSDDGRSCTVPANTFPATSSLMYRVRITDNAGTVGSWSDWITFAAETPSLRPVNESPASGYLGRTVSNIFAWGLAYNRPEYSGLTQTAATVEWRVGSSGTTHSVSAGTAQSVTFAAGTFPASSEIQWRVTVTDSGGTQTTGDWKVLNTTESTPVVTATSPATAYVTGDQPVRFSWAVSFAQGGTQKTFTLEALTGGSSVTVKTGTQPETFTDILPAELPSGQIKWRVKVTNADDVASEWSNYLDVIVVTPPAAPAVTITDQSPMAAVSWESAEQQAYELRVNGVSTGVLFGTNKSYRVPYPLPDGAAAIAVRVLSSFGFWSDWAEVSLTISNTPGVAFPLTVSGAYDASLSWDAVSGAVSYAVYRDGVPLKITPDTAYTDPGSAGTVRYTVRAIMADGTYTESQSAVAQILPDCPVISGGDGDWLQLRYTAESAPYTNVFAARDVSMTAYSDHVFPVAERSIHRTMTLTLSVAFLRSDSDTARLEALLGEPVYFKDQYGNNVFGVFASYTAMENTFIRAYTLTLEVTDA